MIGAGISIPGIHVPANSINVITGTPIGDVTDIQNWQDSNLLQNQEAAATPGQNIEITFVDVTDFRRVGVSMYYAGGAAHWMEIQLWNVTEAAWKIFWTFSVGFGLNYRYSDIPETPDAFRDFIDGSGDVKMRLLHPAMGNAAHNSFIDYAALIR